jgi:drug/metabolite transporter (DMT)-like permease
MLQPMKKKANVGTVLGLGAILAARLTGTFEESGAMNPSIVAIALIAAGTVGFVYGCWQYARSKGHSGAWGMAVPVGFVVVAVCWFYVGEYRTLLRWTGTGIAIVGLFILAFLPDEHPWGK